MSTATEQGLYQPGQTFLHRLDPRVKVLSCLLLIMLAFAATGWAQSFTLIISVSVVFWWIPSLTSSIWRLCWMLRWLLLFTLLMYVFFSPGRTLWGLLWLSLDGLLMGAFVCLQMLFAVTVSAMMAITTSTKNMTRAFGWFVQPLQWLGCRTEEWQKMLLLTMDFIPIVQAEIRVTTAFDVDTPAEPTQLTFKSRWTLWAQKLQKLLFRLVERGDGIAHQIAANEDSSRLSTTLSPLLPLALLDQLFTLVITLLIASYWLVG